MDQAWAALRKGHPLRTDIIWQLVLVEGNLAIGLGLYALLAEGSVRAILVS